MKCNNVKSSEQIEKILIIYKNMKQIDTKLFIYSNSAIYFSDVNGINDINAEFSKQW